MEAKGRFMNQAELLKVLKENQKMIAGWGIALVLAVGAWKFFSKSPAEVSADTAPTNTSAPAVAPVSVPSNAPLSSVSSGNKSAVNDEYQYISKMSNLQGAQLQKFERACADREAVLSFWAKGPGKKGEETRTALKDAKANNVDEKTLNELQIKNDLLIQIENDMRTVLRANVMAELSLEQQRRWGGFVLNRELVKRLSRIELSEKQKEFVRRLADDASDPLTRGDTLLKDPFLLAYKTNEIMDPLVKQTRDKILTIEQRARIPDPGKISVKATGSAAAQ